MALSTNKRMRREKHETKSNVERYHERKKKDADRMKEKIKDNSEFYNERREQKIRRMTETDSSNIHSNYVLDKKLEDIPLVFTTRVDDMLAVSHSEIILENNDNLLEDIEAESKPTFNKFPKKRKRPACKKYYLLKRKLDNYFLIKASLKEYNRTKNERILPSRLFSKLEDISKMVLSKLEDVPNTSHVNDDNNDDDNNDDDYNDESNNNDDIDDSEKLETSDDFKQDTVTFELSDSEGEPVEKCKTTSVDEVKKSSTVNDTNHSNSILVSETISVKALIQAYFKKRYIAISAKKDNFTIVYGYNNGKNPTTMLGFDQSFVDVEKFERIFYGVPLEILYKCCWYSLIDHVQRAKVSMNLPTPFHRCQQYCQCCCYKLNVNNFMTEFIIDDSTSIKKKDMSVEEENQNQMEWTSYRLRFQLLQKRKPSKLIQKALAYTPPILIPSKQKKYKHCKGPNSTLCFVSRKKKWAECFTKSTQGHILGHHMNKGDFMNLFKMQNRINFYNFCCWTSLSNIILDKFSGGIKLTPQASKFIKRTHRCPPGSCVCCCQRTETKNMQGNITLNSAYLNLPNLDNIKSKPIVITDNQEGDVICADNELIDPLSTSRPQSPEIPNYPSDMNNDDDVTLIITDPYISPESPKNNTSYMNNDELEDVTLSTDPNVSGEIPKNYTSYMNNDKLEDITPKNTNPCILSAAPIYFPATLNCLPTNVLPVVSIPEGNRPIPDFTGDMAKQVLKAIAEIPEAQPNKVTICETFQYLNITLDKKGKATASLNKPFTLLSCLELRVLSKILDNGQLAADKITRKSFNSPVLLPKPPEINTRQGEKILLLKRCSKTAGSKSKAFKDIIKTALGNNIDNILPPDQIQNCDAFTQCDTPGPSGVNTMENQPKNVNKQISENTAGYVILIPNTLLPIVNEQKVTSITPTNLNQGLNIAAPTNLNPGLNIAAQTNLNPGLNIAAPTNLNPGLNIATTNINQGVNFAPANFNPGLNIAPTNLNAILNIAEPVEQATPLLRQTNILSDSSYDFCTPVQIAPKSNNILPSMNTFDIVQEPVTTLIPSINKNVPIQDSTVISTDRNANMSSVAESQTDPLEVDEVLVKQEINVEGDGLMGNIALSIVMPKK